MDQGISLVTGLPAPVIPTLTHQDIDPRFKTHSQFFPIPFFPIPNG